MVKYHQGFYRPENPDKYIGDPSNIVYRSSWEMRVMRWLDRHPEIKKWGSEEIIIPYVSPIDNKVHRYFMDFVIHFKDGRKMLVEVKPSNQTKPPKKGRSQKRFVREGMEYIKNKAKWEAARKWAKKRGYEFKILTEHDLP